MALERVPPLFTFTVEGIGAFPIDMLRHDSCWPHSETDSGKILKSFEPRFREYQSIRVVRRGTDPTVGRWESFGWRVRT